MAFVKLDNGILDSTLWQDREAREIFVTALLMALPKEFPDEVPAICTGSNDESGFLVPPGWYGFVPAAGPGIVRRAGIDRKTGMEALERLCSPDDESRTPANEGRRMARVDGGYVVLNYDLYRNKDHTAAERMQRYRERKKAKDDPSRYGVTLRNRNNKNGNVAQAYAYAEEEYRKNEFEAATTSKDKTYELSQSTESVNLYEPKKSESQAQKVAAADSIISLEVFLQIAEKINVDKDFTTALHSDLVASGWTDAKGARVVSPAIFLRKAWERGKVSANNSTPSIDGKREAWHIEADIRRMNEHIERIQKDPNSRNSALGVSETREQHRERLQPKWLAFISPMRAEFQQKLPADWSEYQNRLATQRAACEGTLKAIQAWESDEYQLGLLAEMFPKDVPTFERWVKDFENDPWLDPLALTFDAQGDMRDWKEQIKRLQAELAGVLK